MNITATSLHENDRWRRGEEEEKKRRRRGEERGEKYSCQKSKKKNEVKNLKKKLRTILGIGKIKFWTRTHVDTTTKQTT